MTTAEHYSRATPSDPNTTESQPDAGPTHPIPLGGLPSLLVVDDQDDAAETLAFLLQLHGFPVRTASDGAQALAAIAREVPDVVLLDLRMPVVDGWELTRRIRAGCSPTTKRPFMVAITGCTAQEDQRRAEEAGVDLVLMKPVEPAFLIGLLRRFARVLAPGRPIRHSA